MAWDGNKLMKEVVMGEPELKSFYDHEPGFLQFVERHALVAGDPETRREYDTWRHEQWLRALDLRDKINEGRAEGRAEGIDLGKLEIALEAFKKAGPGEDFSIIERRLIDWGVSPNAVQTARKLVESERPPRG